MMRFDRISFFTVALLCATGPDAARSDDEGQSGPWRDTGIDLSFLGEKVDNRNCSGSDRSFLSCIGAVQRVLDVHGGDLHLVPLADLTSRSGSARIVRRFGAAAVAEDPGLRVRADGNALEAIRARTRRILRWRDRLDRGLHTGIDFSAIRRWLESDIIDRSREATFAAAVIDGYLGVGDAHARIAPASTVRGTPAGRRGANPGGANDVLVYSGIGAGVQPMADAAMITSVLRGGPAAKAGLRAHDFLLEVDGRSVTGLTGEALVERLRGRSGTQVTLLLKRQYETFEASVRRDAVTVRNTVSSAFVDRGWQFAYLKIDSFLRPDTCQGVSREIEKQLKPTLNGLILDLRNNSGGLIDQAVCVADLFLPPGEVVLEVRNVKENEKAERIRTREEARALIPLVTLVNATTGSASEVLAGALQDHGRSLIVGELTFGKGTVQTVRPWKGSRSIMEFYTAARYYRPSGVGVQLIGIEPDIGVFERPGPEPRNRIVLRERDLFPTALPRGPEVWKHPNPSLAQEIRACTTEKGLALNRMRQDAEMSRSDDYPLAVGQDALVCSLTRPL
jgi:carboxyl-terminal processing protease